MDLAHLKNNPGARHRTKRLGCGIGSGHGKTSGRGGKGQTARTGSSIRPGFEGGQMPLYRRIPKRGFNSFTQDVYAVINVGSLNLFSNGDVVTPSVLKSRGLVRSFESGIKILGDGELKKKITVVVNAFSNSAIKKIESVSGQCLIATKVEALKDYEGQEAIDIKKATPAKISVPSPKTPLKPKVKSHAGDKVAKQEKSENAAPPKDKT